MRRLSFTAIIIFGSAIGWGADYLADGPDNGRTGWVRDEKIFNTTNVKSMKLLWKIKLDSPPREMHNFFAPLVAEKVATPSGDKEIAVIDIFVGGITLLVALNLAFGPGADLARRWVWRAGAAQRDGTASASAMGSLLAGLPSLRAVGVGRFLGRVFAR